MLSATLETESQSGPSGNVLALGKKVADQTYALSIGVAARLFDDGRMSTELAPALIGLAGDLERALSVHESRKVMRQRSLHRVVPQTE